MRLHMLIMVSLELKSEEVRRSLILSKKLPRVLFSKRPLK